MSFRSPQSLASEQISSHFLLACHFALLFYDPVAFGIIHQALAKHRICLQGPCSHMFRSAFHEISHGFPGEYEKLEADASCFTLSFA